MRAVTHALTLSLWLKHGAFWEGIASLRDKYQINAAIGLPTFDAVRDATPKGFPAHNIFRRRQWEDELARLRDEVVPLPLRTGRVGAEEFWRDFLTACVFFDPPGDQLLEFADNFLTPGTADRRLLAEWQVESEGLSPVSMIAPPIRVLADPDQAMTIVVEDFLRILREVDARLASSGVNVLDTFYAVRADLERVEPSLDEALGELWERAPAYIVVDELTTEDDVRRAFRLIAAELARRPAARRPHVDDLVAVQCAVWRDHYHWSHEQLAARFGWAMQDHKSTTSWSETARRHIDRGREIQDERKQIDEN